MSESLMPKEWIERLFLRFQTLYGSRATAMWNDVPKADLMDAWQTGLASYTGTHMVEALSELPKRYPDWPPTLGEFMGLCKEAWERQLVDPSKRIVGPKTTMPEHIRKQLREFIESHRVKA